MVPACDTRYVMLDADASFKHHLSGSHKNRTFLRTYAESECLIFCAICLRQLHAAHWLWCGPALPGRTTASFLRGRLRRPRTPTVQSVFAQNRSFVQYIF